jgi:hypothetical protein
LLRQQQGSVQRDLPRGRAAERQQKFPNRHETPPEQALLFLKKKKQKDFFILGLGRL